MYDFWHHSPENIKLLDSVQRRSIRTVDSLEKKNVFEKQLKLLDLFSPEKRRVWRDLMVAYNFHRRGAEVQELIYSGDQ